MTSSVVYATVDEFKAQPGISGTGSDIPIELFLMAASRAIDGYCNRLDDGFVADDIASSREFVGTGKSFIWIPEAAEISMVEDRLTRSDNYVARDVDEWAGFTGNPNSPTLYRAPFTGVTLVGNPDQSYFCDGQGVEERGFPPIVPMATVRVTAKWGYSLTCPDVVKSATLAQASIWFKRGQSFWADAAASSDFGQIMYTKAIDPAIMMMLNYARMIKPTYAGK